MDDARIAWRLEKIEAALARIAEVLEAATGHSPKTPREEEYQ